MASKVKRYNHYIVLHRARTKALGCTTLGRYIVAAKNEKEAEQFVKEAIGKYENVKVYYQLETDIVQEYVKLRHNKNKLDYREVRKD